VTPWAPHLHAVALAVTAAVAGAWVLLVTRGTRPTRRQWGLAAGALGAMLVAVASPLADLAARTSLIALMGQRLLFTLVVAPLALAATPEEVLSAWTRPAVADRLLATLTRPTVAVAAFSAVAVGTLLPPLVQAQATSVAARGAVDALVLLGGVVLWGPVLTTIPGASRPGPMGRAVYLVVQSLVPTLLAVVLVFARHPFYPVYAHGSAALGLSAVADQQVAGILGKVGTLPVLWTVAWREVGRARRLDEAGDDPEPLRWLDVQRRLERAERAEASARRPRPGRPDWRPRLATRFPTAEPPRARPTPGAEQPRPRPASGAEPPAPGDLG
jgi:cytochrome c oxidase assembly factor CtaG